MNCPVCDQKLRTTEKYSVATEICPDCKGVWLDRGSLERIVEAALRQSAVATEERRPPSTLPGAGENRRPDPQFCDRDEEDDYRRRRHGHDNDDDDDEGGGLFGFGGRTRDQDDNQRKGSWLSNLFRGLHD